MAKKEKPDVNIRGLSMRATINQLNKVFGINTLALASDAVGLTVQLISTGVAALDVALGGGIPKNRITEFFGGESSLKSTVLCNTIANFQRMHKEGYSWIEDGEHSFDPIYARRCGVDLERLGIINADNGEQAVDVIRSVIENDGDVFVGLDSIASLVPGAEMEASAEQQFQALHPRLVGKLMRILRGAMKRNLYDTTAGSATVIGTNQTRDAMGAGFSYETTPGGKAKNFYFSVRIHFASSKKHVIMATLERNGIKRECRVGQVVEFDIKKNKISGTQFESGEFCYFTREHKGHAPYSFNNEETLFKFGVFFGIIKRIAQKKGEQFQYGDLVAAESAFKQSLIADGDTALSLYSEIIDQVRQEEETGLAEPTVVPVKRKIRIHVG
jgi:protein RecA